MHELSSRRLPDALPTNDKAERAFFDFVKNERTLRVRALARAILDITEYTAAEYLATQPVRIDKRHPAFGQAARCAEILTGCDSSDVVCVHVDPSREGPLKRGEIATVVVMVYTSDHRWHEVPDVTIERLAGAWLDARQ